MHDRRTDRAWKLLRLGRADDAFNLAGEVLTGSPDDVHALVLMGSCLLELDRTDDAELLWRRASAAHPANIDVAVIGVRCATKRQEIRDRAERLLSLDANHVTVLYWYAIAAARTGRRQVAEETVAKLRAVDPVSATPRYAEVRVDLILSGRLRPAVNAERVLAKLLAENPNDVVAHDLRLRAAQLRSERFFGRRNDALGEVDVIRTAAAAGVQPSPGRLSDLTDRASGTATAILFVTFAYLGGGAVEAGAMSWPIAAVAVAGCCVTLWLVTLRRMVRLIRSLPGAGWHRMLRPAFYMYVITGGIVALLGFGALAYLYPYDVERAEQVRVTIDVGETEGFDADAAVELIRFWAAVAAFAPFAAAGLFWQAYIAHTGNIRDRPMAVLRRRPTRVGVRRKKRSRSSG